MANTVCTLKLTEEERKWLKWQIVANQTTASQMIADKEVVAKDYVQMKQMMETNNSILRKLF